MKQVDSSLLAELGGKAAVLYELSGNAELADKVSNEDYEAMKVIKLKLCMWSECVCVGV